MADLGIGGIGGADDDDDDDDDDESLEAELAALQGESRSKVKKKSKCSYNATWDSYSVTNSTGATQPFSANHKTS